MFSLKLYLRCLLILFFSGSLFLVGCTQKFLSPEGVENVALVNGYGISWEEFKRKLGKFHSVKDISEKVDPTLATVDYFGILNSLIDERLMIQEAKRLGFQGVAEYETSHRYSKVNLELKLLKLDEVDAKVVVPEEELTKTIEHRFETVEVWHLFSKSEETAKEFLKILNEGGSFETLVVDRSEDPPSVRTAKGFIGTKRRHQLAKELSEAAFALSEGEHSEVISTWRGYHIIKVGKKYVPDVGAKEKRRIYDKIFVKLAEAREQEFFKELKEEYDVNVNEDILAMMTLSKKRAKGEVERGLIVATVGGDPIMANDVYSRLMMYDATTEEEFNKGRRHIIDGLLRQKMLDMDVERRNYLSDPRYIREFAMTEDFLYLDFFKKIIVGENVIVGKDEPLSYYKDNPDKYRKPLKVKLRAILVTEKKQAEDIKRGIDLGDDFGTLAREVSIDRSAKKKGDVGWLRADEFPDKIRSVLEKGKINSVSGPLRTNDGFLILKIEDREEGALKPFKAVERQIGKQLADEKYLVTFKRYVEDLRRVASIEMNNKFVQKYVDSKTKFKSVGRKNK